ncbi:MAG: hypothetical protein PVH11_05795 [Anaerolineae bacterium]
MTQSKRVIIALVILVVLIGLVLGVDALRRRLGAPAQGAQDMPTPVPGAIPIYLDEQLVGAFAPTDLEEVQTVSFVDAEEGKTQEGWLLRDVLLLHVPEESLPPGATVIVTSSSRDKSAEFTWAEVQDPDNWVMFDLSGRGTLKLVSVLERLDIRDEWVQDVDRIDIIVP